jgi:type VI protein secretion system component VasK
MTIAWEAIIPKFDAVLARGLCQGVGDRDGQMCIEAAICYALDLPHGDEPDCVTPEVRSYKIWLNDAPWSSPEARAAGLRDLGIAQIGSKGVVDGRAFTTALAEQTIRVLIPMLFREVFTQDTVAHQRCRDAADRCEREGTRAAAAAAAAAYAAAAYAAAAYAAAAAAAPADAAAAAYAAAAYAAAAYAAAAAAAAYAAADAARRATRASRDPDRYLKLSASLALAVLRDLNSPGCAWVEWKGGL